MFDLIVSALENKENRTIEGRRELLGMALSMNQSTNRKEDRISVLCKCLSMDVKDLVLIPNNYLDVQIPLSSEFISGRGAQIKLYLGHPLSMVMHPF